MKKLFIVGCPRSGTTMLQQALNRHSQIVIPPETKFFFNFYGQSRSRRSAHLKRLNADLGIQVRCPPGRICGPEPARAFYDQMAHMYLAHLGRADVVYFGDKTPEHTGQLHRVCEVFPDAKVIFMYRDGRDVASSLTKVPWIRCDLYMGMVIWLYYYRILRASQRDRSLDICYVRYEDLVAAPAQRLNEVLEFLGLPYEAAVAEGCGNREGIPERELPWKGRALEPITSARVGTWERELTASQITMLERLGGAALRDLNYELAALDPAPLPPWFRVRVGWAVGRLACQLPWASLFQEFSAAVMRLGEDTRRALAPQSNPAASRPAGVNGSRSAVAECVAERTR